MIARLWHGVVPSGKAEEYHNYLSTAGFHEYNEIAGNRGAYLFERMDGSVTHFLMLSFWDSLEAIKEYSGPEVSAARYTEVDRNFLLELEPTVTHYAVFAESCLAAYMCR